MHFIQISNLTRLLLWPASLHFTSIEKRQIKKIWYLNIFNLFIISLFLAYFLKIVRLMSLEAPFVRLLFFPFSPIFKLFVQGKQNFKNSSKTGIKTDARG